MKLEEKKFDITMTLIEMQEEYLSIDKIFEEEMDKYRYKNRYLPKILETSKNLDVFLNLNSDFHL